MYIVYIYFFQVMGVKGASILCIHRPFDLSKGVAIDDLHVIFLGTVSDLLNYWFDERFKTKPFSIYRKVCKFIYACMYNIIYIVCQQ